jgi:hypothetical protein
LLALDAGFSDGTEEQWDHIWRKFGENICPNLAWTAVFLILNKIVTTIISSNKILCSAVLND